MSPKRWYLWVTPVSEGHGCFIHYWNPVLLAFYSLVNVPFSLKGTTNGIIIIIISAPCEACLSGKPRNRVSPGWACFISPFIKVVASPPYVYFLSRRYVAGGLPSEHPGGIEEKLRTYLSAEYWGCRDQDRAADLIIKSTYTVCSLFKCILINKLFKLYLIILMHLCTQ